MLFNSKGPVVGKPFHDERKLNLDFTPKTKDPSYLISGRGLRKLAIGGLIVGVLGTSFIVAKKSGLMDKLLETETAPQELPTPSPSGPIELSLPEQKKASYMPEYIRKDLERYMSPTVFTFSCDFPIYEGRLCNKPHIKKI